MMISGASLVGLQLAATAFGPVWKLQFASLLMMGWGFYMIHGCLQVFASELSVEARATALSLHSFFFFMGQTVGPIAYGFGIQHAARCRPACSRSRDESHWVLPARGCCGKAVRGMPARRAGRCGLRLGAGTPSRRRQARFSGRRHHHDPRHHAPVLVFEDVAVVTNSPSCVNGMSKTFAADTQWPLRPLRDGADAVLIIGHLVRDGGVGRRHAQRELSCTTRIAAGHREPALVEMEVVGSRSIAGPVPRSPSRCLTRSERQADVVCDGSNCSNWFGAGFLRPRNDILFWSTSS